jgi:hypothetical protein
MSPPSYEVALANETTQFHPIKLTLKFPDGPEEQRDENGNPSKPTVVEIDASGTSEVTTEDVTDMPVKHTIDFDYNMPPFIVPSINVAEFFKVKGISNFFIL